MDLLCPSNSQLACPVSCRGNVPHTRADLGEDAVAAALNLSRQSLGQPEAFDEVGPNDARGALRAHALTTQQCARDGVGTRDKDGSSIRCALVC